MARLIQTACRVRNCRHARPCPVHPVRPHDDRGGSTARGYGYAWQVIRTRVLARHPGCAAPTCTARAVDVDHIVPLAQGGTHDEKNLQPLCRSHHNRKTRMGVESSEPERYRPLIPVGDFPAEINRLGTST